LFHLLSMNEKTRKIAYQTAQALAIASAAFLLLAGGLLVYNQTRGKVAGIAQSKEFARLQAELKKLPRKGDKRADELKEYIRQYDLQLRQSTFHQLELSADTSQAIVWALVLFLASAHLVRVFRQPPPNPLTWPGRHIDQERRIPRFGRYAVAAAFGFTAAIAAAVSVNPVRLPAREVKIEAPEVPATAEELKANWLAFRGPNGQNFTPEAGPAALAVLWKTPVPLPGMSSPVRWENGLFLTGANKEEERVYRFDAETGTLVWSATVKIPNAPKPGQAEVNEGTGYAAPSPATDGRRVYALFANGDVAAFTLDGKQVWAKNLGLPTSQYGLSASLVVCQGLLVIQFDQGAEEDGKSRLLALDGKTGAEKWSVKRAVGNSWSSPVVMEVDGQAQIVCAGTPVVSAHDPTDGHELWKAAVLHGDVAPSPVLAGNLVVVTVPGKELLALNKGATAWQFKDGAPETSSPATDGRRLFVVAGTSLVCLDAAIGKALWTEDVGEEAYATPLVFTDRVLVVLREGGLRLVANGDKFAELSKAELGEKCDTTPLTHAGKVFVRGEKHLFGLGAAKGN
jgi:outer membrane protein assembly factor BamB